MQPTLDIFRINWKRILSGVGKDEGQTQAPEQEVAFGGDPGFSDAACAQTDPSEIFGLALHKAICSSFLDGPEMGTFSPWKVQGSDKCRQ